MCRKVRIQVRAMAGLLGVLCFGLMAINDPGCCNRPNDSCPPTYREVKDVHFMVYGDSIASRYQHPLSNLLVGDLGKEGVPNRTALISRFTRANSQDRCACSICKVAFDCLCAFPPLENVQAKYVDAETLMITLGANDMKEEVLMPLRGLPASSKDPIVSDAYEKIEDRLNDVLDIAMTKFSPDRIYLTSYHYFPLDSSWGECFFSTPLSPQDQKTMNELVRLLDVTIRSVAQARGVHFISFLDALGGGEPVGHDGETGPDRALFEDCFHPNPTGASILADIVFNVLASE